MAQKATCAIVREGVDICGIGDGHQSRTEDLDEEVDSLQIRKLVIVRINADAEEEAGVATINDFVVPKLLWRRVASMSGERLGKM